MTFTLAAARGIRAADRLSSAMTREGSNGAVALRRHADIAVAWSTTSPWVDVHDDGDLLCLVDGTVHHPATSARPAEHLAQRYRSKGTAAAEGLLGDFVLLVLDRTARRLLVARDPLGARPWHQAGSDPDHTGASDVATLVRQGLGGGLDEVVALQYLAAMWVSGGETLHAGIRTLAPGTTWTIDASGCGRTNPHHRWRSEPDLGVTWDDAAQRSRDVLERAVADRLATSPHAPTCELSGGLDSSTVVGTAVKLGSDGIVAGRLLFEGPAADERAYSDAVIEHWGLDAVSAAPWVPDADERQELARQLGRPVPAPQFTMFADLYRTFAAHGRLSTLTGLGGDDAFVGMHNGMRMVSAIQLRQRAVLSQLAAWARRHPREAWPELLAPTARYVLRRGDRRPYWMSVPAKKRGRVLHADRQRPAALTNVAAIDGRYANITSGYDAFILEDSAVVGDLVGVRATHPFLDPRFIDATYALDPWWPTYGGHTRALQVAAYRDRLPDAVAQRRTKSEFSEIFWPVVTDDAVRRVRTGPLSAAGWLDLDGFDALAADGHRRVPAAAIPLFRCISLDEWLRFQ